MRVTKEQIKKGIIKYLENEVVGKINEKSLKIVMSIAVGLIKNEPKAIDALLNNAIVRMLLVDENGYYNLDSFKRETIDALDKYGTFDLKLPMMSSPFMFNRGDVESLIRYIEEGATND